MRNRVRAVVTLGVIALVGVGVFAVNDLWSSKGMRVSIGITCPNAQKTKIYLSGPGSLKPMTLGDGTIVAYDPSGNEASGRCDVNGRNAQDLTHATAKS